MTGCIAGWREWFPLIERAVGDLSTCMLAQTGVDAGHRVLDLATGIGEPALAAAERVGPDGHVLGVDISPAMIDVARARAEALGVSNAAFRVMDVERLSLTEEFDAVLSRCGLMFVDDLRGTLERVRRVLVPGGRISAAVWASADETPTLSLAERTAHRVLELPPPHEGDNTPFALGDTRAAIAVMKQAGFEGGEAETVPVTFELTSADRFIAYREALSSRFAAALDGRDSRDRDAVAKAITAALEPYHEPDGTIRMVNRAYCLTAVSSG